ncbi:MAG: polyprenyl synthetase family protein [SAR202 cluster bacterium]|nr:polyprenyl synthetase family protein [SAR202 cluster bacterium]
MQTVSIYEPIQEGLARVEHGLKNVPTHQFPFLSQLLGHVFETSGKRIRPAVTLLAGGFNPHDGKKSEIMATAVELLHIATLIHDDMVDDSDVRHGRSTISSLWGRKAAVLVGDYIFAASATHVCETENIRVIRRFSENIMELSTGELQEMAEAYNCDLTMEQYLDRIYNKTASLLTTAGEAGAVLSGAPEDTVRALREYGYNLGMAFQIVDDILDFEGTQEEVGKPVGNDLSLGILTLPAILALEHQPKGNPIAGLFQHPHEKGTLARAVEMIQNSSVIEESYTVAEKYCRNALDALTGLDSNPSRESLEELVGYVLERRS